jgi:hypothetical protein
MGQVFDAFQPMILSMVLVALGIGTWAGWELSYPPKIGQ